MTEGTENLVLEHLLAIRGDMAEISDDLRIIRGDLAAMYRMLSGSLTQEV